MDWTRRAKEIVELVAASPVYGIVDAVAERLRRAYTAGLEGHGGRYAVVEIEMGDHAFQLEDSAARVKGPLGNALLVVYPHDALHNLLQHSSDIGAFRERVVKTFQEAGFTEEILIIADDMKFARFERVEGEDGEEEGA